MKLIFVFTIILIKVFLIHLFEVMEIVRASGIDTFVYTEEHAVFIGNQGS